MISATIRLTLPGPRARHVPISHQEELPIGPGDVKGPT